ncbi:MAG: hypothetical protein ACRDYU_03365, partial [Actinomycetes bacterium]
MTGPAWDTTPAGGVQLISPETTNELDRSRPVYLLHEDLARAQMREREAEARRDQMARRVVAARRQARRAEGASRR